MARLASERGIRWSSCNRRVRSGGGSVDGSVVTFDFVLGEEWEDEGVGERSFDR